MNRQELTQKSNQNGGNNRGKGVCERGGFADVDGSAVTAGLRGMAAATGAYLERVIQGNLSRISFIMKTFAGYAGACGLKPSWTAYQSWGKGAKIRLRFSKSGLEQIERAYATHFVLTSARGAITFRQGEEG